MIFAACFTLLKLLSSFFAKEIEFDRGRDLFHRTIRTIRSMSIINNDLPWRLAELMVQMWNGARIEQRSQLAQMSGNNGTSHETRTSVDDSLQLKVRCRMSMSLVFDSIWRWREEFQAQGRGSIEGQFAFRSAHTETESSGAPYSTHLSTTLLLPNQSNAHLVAAMKNPTNPDSAAESSASSTHLDTTLMPPSHQLQNQLLAAAAGAVTPNHGLPSHMMSGVGYSESNYEVFDPLNWMLDGLVDFPYSYAAVQGLEANGMS
jgi:hypothetical protein